MKKLIVLLLVLGWLYQTTNAQVINYVYDNAGNRTDRIEITLSSTDGESLMSPEGEFNPNKLELENFEDYIGEQNLKIYPNPTRGELVVEFLVLPEDKGITVILYNSGGKIIMQKPVDQNILLVDINDKPGGNYILVLKLGSMEKSYQIVKR